MLLMPNGKDGKSFYFIKNDVSQDDIDEFVRINLQFIDAAKKWRNPIRVERSI